MDTQNKIHDDLGVPLAEPPSDPGCPIRHTALVQLTRRVTTLEQEQQAMQKAFLLNDLGEKDYEGHRLDHKERKDAAEHMDELKLGGARKLVDLALGAVTTLILLGGVEWLKAASAK